MGNLLWVLAIVLVGLWVLGLVTNVTVGGFIHLFLILAVVVVLVRIFTGRRIA